MQRPIMRQQWLNLLFLHWGYPPETVQKTLPPGLEPDCFDGQAWVAVVPFFMCRVRPVGLPAVPMLSWFLELNVRTYVRAGDQTGVWFYSLDCNQPLAVEIARAGFSLPYEHARMRARHGLMIDYHCHRYGLEEAWRYTYRGDGLPRRALNDSFETYLLERYHLISPRRAGGFFCGRVAHAPYQVEAASVPAFDSRPIAAAGLPLPEKPPDHVCYSREVNVEIFPVQAIEPPAIQMAPTS